MKRIIICAALVLGATHALAQGMSKNDTDFINQAAAGGMYEVQAGQLAQNRGRDAQVKSFGAMLVKDHSAANDELKALASRKNVSLPTTLPEKFQKKLDKLSSNSKDFDKTFIDQVGVDDHKTDIGLFEKAGRSADDAEIKAFATKTLPTLRAHREHAEGLKKAMK